ncbi:MAG TPA: glycosyltransferase [Thermoleophilaceae bacterium]
MRILITTTPGRGHWQPMLPLANALVAAGHELRWATAREACGPLRERGFDVVEAGAHDLEMPAFPPEIAALPPAERPERMFGVIFGPRRAAPMLRDLVPVVEDWRPRLLVCDQAELAGPIAAAQAGVLNVTHSFGRLLPEPRVRHGAEAVAGLWQAQGLEPRPYAGTYDHLYLDIYPPSLQTPDIGHVGTRQLVRSVPHIARETDAEPVVYITFGTIFNKDLTLFAAAVEAARELPVDVVVTLGPGNHAGALGDQPANVTVAGYIPQEELLPRCAAVISHGGSGTFLGALAAGVPQLIVPLMADQYLNADAAVEGGVALALRPEDATVAALRDALTRVLDNTDLRAAAGAVARELAAMPSAAEVADELARRFG